VVTPHTIKHSILRFLSTFSRSVAPAFHDGIETHELDGVQVRIYDTEKTLVDCFRYRNQLGMDVAVEALRLWRERRKKKLDVLLKYARMRHVERAMRPYLEATQ
jgi:predicted transcriptional regulator of viral defense system